MVFIENLILLLSWLMMTNILKRLIKGWNGLPLLLGDVMEVHKHPQTNTVKRILFRLYEHDGESS